MPRFQPVPPSASWSWATVEAIADGRADLSFGVDGDATSVPVHGEPPAVGSRVLVLLQGASALVLGRSGTPPRWRGAMASHTVPPNDATKLTTLSGEYTSDRITVSGGTFTVAEAGIYEASITTTLTGGSVTTQRVFVEVVQMTTTARYYRAGFGNGETAGSVTALFGLNAGDSFWFQVYQNTGAALTATVNSIHAVKVGEL